MSHSQSLSFAFQNSLMVYCSFRSKCSVCILIESNDSALHHVCLLATKQKKISGNYSDQSFVLMDTVTGKIL